MDTINVETSIFFSTVKDEGKVYSDQIGHFLVTFSRGEKYVFILYSYNISIILSDPLKIRMGKDILHAYTTCYYYLK